MHRHWSTCRRTKDGRNSFSWLDYPWNSFVCHYGCFQLGKISTYQFAAHFTYWALSFRDVELDNIWPTPFRNYNRQFHNKSRKQPTCKSLANARAFSTRDFAAFCDTTCKNNFMCASGEGKRSKRAKNKFKKQCIVAMNARVKVQLTTSNLSWTHKFPQSEMFLQEIKKQTELWICQFFYRVSVYNPFGFLCQMALVRPYCCEIVQVSLVNHQNHSFNRRIQLANCFQPPAH